MDKYDEKNKLKRFTKLNIGDIHNNYGGKYPILYESTIGNSLDGFLELGMKNCSVDISQLKSPLYYGKDMKDSVFFFDESSNVWEHKQL